MADRIDAIVVFLTLAPWSPPPPNTPPAEIFDILYDHTAEHFPNLTKHEFAEALKLVMEEGFGMGQSKH
ncbi:hypothetical protein [Methylobacterium sp. J-090]|uniref:hypothetical protein n=1 Tax=Methylobacterium sp. J-090 TaxID=2836666 RepID=UPI001FBB1140|nr:hypothetical protein [Methylobacterium sp. J-090]MCJ2080143.1 hypothetical protein [Methylobacterium sp. J-090]